jgi:hypothetical protein
MSEMPTEDEVRPVDYKNMHFTKYAAERFQSRLDGKVYGPYFRCQVDRIPEDVSEQLFRLGYVEESRLTPTEIARLYEGVFVPTLAGKLDPRMYMRFFYGMLDHRFGYQGNVGQVLHETQKLSEKYMPAITYTSQILQTALNELESLTES